MPRLVQLQRESERRIALVEEPRLRLLKEHASVYSLANAAITARVSLTDLVQQLATSDALDYDAVYAGRSEWKLLSPIDHPDDPARCLVSGTGLTHLGSAKNRHAMHEASASETDSMRMFRWGVEAGRPAAGQVGIAPEWFYKGNGTILRAPGEALEVPFFGEDGGEEGEIAGLYVIDPTGAPRRIGMCLGNEFSDHRFEKKNYLNLAGSKIRTCSIGPEIVLDPQFDSVPGKVTIVRGAKTIWSKEICTGEKEMCHSLPNIEHHHFKFETHRRPGDVHVHYFGACSLSFGDGVQLENGDVMEITFTGFGRPLQNPLSVNQDSTRLITIKPL